MKKPSSLQVITTIFAITVVLVLIAFTVLILSARSQAPTTRSPTSMTMPADPTPRF